MKVTVSFDMKVTVSFGNAGKSRISREFVTFSIAEYTIVGQKHSNY